MADCFSLPNAADLVKQLRSASELGDAPSFDKFGVIISKSTAQHAADAIEALTQENAKLKEKCDKCGEGAHSVIKELIEQNAKLKAERGAAPQWISVKERMPEEDDNTEAWYESSDGFRARSVIVYNGRSVFPANRFRASTGEPYEWSIPAKNATHWMPLPEPPKEE